jgi:cold-inducible RNA-binding protein
LKKLYVGNVPFQATDEELKAWFSAAGVNTSSVTLVRDRATGQPRGFGFVEVPSDEEADKGIATLNGKDFLGRPLVVNEARPARERGPGGGGGGRGAGGGGGRGGGGGGRGRDY